MDTKISFIKNQLCQRIITENADLQSDEFLDCVVELPHNLDGFLSTIFIAKLTFR